MSTPLIADQAYTINHYLERSGRESLPLHRRFLQQKEKGGNLPGPLAAFVKRIREPALDQYLFAHAVASARDEQSGEFDVRLQAATWARAVGGYFDPATGVVAPSALHAVSRNWSFCKEQKLIASARVGRRARIWLLADDGSGTPYKRPAAGQLGKQLEDGDTGYLQLPYAYWLEDWHKTLDLAAKAMLLIALSLGDGFTLPAKKVPDWYGISDSTAERGLRDLRNHGLLHRERHRRPDTESPVGFSDVYYYELLSPFGPRGVASKGQHPDYRGPSRRASR